MFLHPHKTNKCKIRTSRLAALIHLAITLLRCRFQVNSSPNSLNNLNSCPTQWATRWNNKTWWWCRCSKPCNNSSRPTWWCNSSNRCRVRILLQQECKVPTHLWLILKLRARMLLALSHSSSRCPSTIRIKCKAIIHLVRCDSWYIYIYSALKTQNVRPCSRCTHKTCLHLTNSNFALLRNYILEPNLLFRRFDRTI